MNLVEVDRTHVPPCDARRTVLGTVGSHSSLIIVIELIFAVFTVQQSSFPTTTMRLLFTLSLLASVVAADRLGQTNRDLQTNCIGSVLPAGHALEPGESICDTLPSGEVLYYGVVASPGVPESDYTRYLVRLWSSEGTYFRNFLGIGSPSANDAPELRFQLDGNLVFSSNSQSGGCLTKPKSTGHEVRVVGNLYPDFVHVVDSNSEIIVKIYDKVLSNNSTYITSTECYPDQQVHCIDVFPKKTRISWKEYLCDYDSEGNVASQFGLNDHGKLHLLRDGAQVWHAGNKRGDYLHLQSDGHLTLYRDTSPKKTYTWASRCRDSSVEKITIADGDVHEFDDDGSVIWAVRGDAADVACFV